MRVKSGLCLSLVGAGALAACGLCTIVATPVRADGGDVIEVSVQGVRSDRGEVSCALYAGPDGYPTKPDKAIKFNAGRIQSGVALMRFEVPAGASYALACYHDENGNGKMDLNWLGIPKEGVGASNEARGHMGPPRFKDAAFSHGGGVTKVVLHIKY